MNANITPDWGDEGRLHAARKPWSDEECGRYLADLAAVLHLLGTSKRILDLGCGTGWTSRFLAQAGHTVTGVDISEDAIALARSLPFHGEAERLTFVAADYELWKGQADYDAVLFYDALHHAEDEALALQVAFDSLKPGGLLIALEPGRGHSQSAGAQEAVARFGVHEKDMPPTKIWALGRKAGFARKLFLPLPREAQSTLYRRNYLKAPQKARWEWTWGLVRFLQKYFRASQAGMTLLWKP